MPVSAVLAAFTLLTGLYLLGGLVSVAMWAAWSRKRPQLLLDVLVSLAIVALLALGFSLVMSR